MVLRSHSSFLHPYRTHLVVEENREGWIMLSRYSKMVLRLVREGMRPAHAVELVCRTYKVPADLLHEELEGWIHTI